MAKFRPRKAHGLYALTELRRPKPCAWHKYVMEQLPVAEMADAMEVLVVTQISPRLERPCLYYKIVICTSVDRQLYFVKVQLIAQCCCH